MREEYLSRTMFHLKEGRRIVWVFDETMEKPKPGDMGRFRYDYEALVSYQYEHPLFLPVLWQFKKKPNGLVRFQLNPRHLAFP